MIKPRSHVRFMSKPLAAANDRSGLIAQSGYQQKQGHPPPLSLDSTSLYRGVQDFLDGLLRLR